MRVFSPALVAAQYRYLRGFPVPAAVTSYVWSGCKLRMFS